MAFGTTASPLSCECGAVTITASEIPASPSRWGLFLFYRAVVSGTPYYTAPIKGDMMNPSADTKFDVKLPMNASYTFYSFAVAPYDPASTYGNRDWAFNPYDGCIYVSKAAFNTGNTIDNLIWWRKMDCSDWQDVPLKTSNILSGSLYISTISMDVTCNTCYTGLGINMVKSKCDTSLQTLVLVDRTGDFSFDCQPNGYGGPNPFRGDYAQMAILTNTSSDGTVSEFQARPYSYQSGTRYLFDIPRDGVYVLNLYMVPVFGNKLYYNIGEAVFDPISNLFYASLANNNTNPVTDGTTWSQISDFAQFESSIVYKTLLFYYIFDVNAQKHLYDLRDGISKSCPCACGGSSKCGDDLMKKYTFILATINTACFAKELGRYSEAQCFLEKIPKNCSPYISAYKC